MAIETPFFGNPAAQLDLKAIKVYVTNQRPNIDKYPALLPLIDSFESWYANLGWWALNLGISDTTQEARRRRDQINVVQEQVIPADWVPGDAELEGHGTPPLAPKDPWIPTGYKVAAFAGAGATLVLVILKKLRVI